MLQVSELVEADINTDEAVFSQGRTRCVEAVEGRAWFWSAHALILLVASICAG